MRKQGRQQGAHQDHHTAMQCCTEGASQSQLLGESDEWTGGSFKGQLGVPLTMYPWYLVGSLGILGGYFP